MSYKPRSENLPMIKVDPTVPIMLASAKYPCRNIGMTCGSPAFVHELHLNASIFAISHCVAANNKAHSSMPILASTFE